MKYFGVLVAALFALVALPAQAGNPALSEAANNAFLKNYAQKPGVVTTASGLEYRILQNGFGQRPGPFDRVQVVYTGQLIDGTVFDSVEPLTPAVIPVNGSVPGWSEAMQLMRTGDHWVLVIPPNLGYGARGSSDGSVPPDQTLVFDVQLLKVLPPEKTQEDEDKDK